MELQNIVDKMVNKQNFHKYVNICLENNLLIKSKCKPDIVVYLSDDEENYEINPEKYSFVVDGEIMTGNNNFYKNYKNITKFIKGKLELYVEPFYISKEMVKKGEIWYKDDEWCEISYQVHSYQYPMKGKYYIHGEKYKYEEWIKISREQKLKRILDK